MGRPLGSCAFSDLLCVRVFWVCYVCFLALSCLSFWRLCPSKSRGRCTGGSVRALCHLLLASSRRCCTCCVPRGFLRRSILFSWQLSSSCRINTFPFSILLVLAVWLPLLWLFGHTQVPGSCSTHLARCFWAHKGSSLLTPGQDCSSICCVRRIFSKSPNSGAKNTGGFLRSEKKIFPFISPGCESFCWVSILSCCDRATR